MAKNFLRPAAGILVGFLVATLVPSYGGVGVNLLLALVRGEIPRQSVHVYALVASYAVIVTLLLLALGILTLAEFTDWKLRNRARTRRIVCSLLFILPLVHLLTIWTETSIGDQEAKTLFVDGSVLEAVLTIVAVALFVALGRLDNKSEKALA